MRTVATPTSVEARAAAQRTGEGDDSNAALAEQRPCDVVAPVSFTLGHERAVQLLGMG